MKVILEESTPSEGVRRTDALIVVGQDQASGGITAAAVLQLARYVLEQFGEAKGFVIGGADYLTSYSFGMGHVVEVRRPNSDEVRTLGFKKLPQVTLPFQIHIPAQILQESEHDAVLLLRLGAAGNALQTVLQGTTGAADRDGAVKRRDLIHRTLILASYVKEVEKIVHGDKSHRGRLWELARLGTTARFGLPLEVVEEFEQLMNPKGPLMKRIGDLRDFVGFHLLPREFRSWLRKRQPEEKLLLHSEPDPARNDVVFVASAAAIADAYNDDAATAFIAAANRLAWTLPAVIAAATYGLLISKGHDPGRFIAVDAKAALTGVRTGGDESDTDEAQ